MKLGLALILFLLPLLGQAQATTARNHFAVVMYSAMGGAVLGLSTLSFYDKPNEHTDNVTVGAAAGLLLGLAYVSYNSFSAPSEKPKNYDFGLTQTAPENYAFIFTKNF